ncbi:MAG: recombination protein O N-terminal domain-containing protein, partial [Bdellovibrionaceae bacterium]|nr:recombination protein O N-terminal domain-containing protein [Pseudobdellovibrionaceae bacterium]
MSRVGSLEQSGRFIILRKIRYGESDLILQALSVSGEKISFIARGALKSRKRFSGGVLEPGHHVHFTWRKPSGQGTLCVLGDAKLLNDFSGLKESYERLECALRLSLIHI